MHYYYVCDTPGCIRNKPKLFVRGETVESTRDARCQECGLLMTRRARPLKGPNTKPGLRLRSTNPPKLGSRKTSKKKPTLRKKFYKR